MGKHPRGKTFAVFMVFHSTANLFPQIMALLINNINLQQCYSKSCTANSLFLLKIQKFSPVDVYPYTVCLYSINKNS